MFSVNQLEKSFGGLKAVNKVTFTIQKEEVSSIIGPNGAGKTTLFNLLTGHIKADSGAIHFKDENITGFTPHRICHRGIARSFQKTNIFPRLTVFDNIQVALMSKKKKTRNIIQLADIMFKNEADEILETLGIIDKKNKIAGLLAYGDQRLLEIGITLGTDPELILLDEPSAGMSPDESHQTMQLIHSIVSSRKLSLLFIEHDMNIVFGISEKVRVMHFGAIIAEGSPEDIRANKEVQRIYLAEES